MVSPTPVKATWEIWLYAKPDYRSPAQMCGLFQSEDAALRLGAAVRLWLHQSIWTRDILDRLDEEDATDLLTLPIQLRRMGLDCGRVLVTVREYGAHPDHGHRTDDDEDDDFEDTPLEVPSVVYRPEESR